MCMYVCCDGKEGKEEREREKELYSEMMKNLAHSLSSPTIHSIKRYFSTSVPVHWTHNKNDQDFNAGQRTKLYQKKISKI